MMKEVLLSLSGIGRKKNKRYGIRLINVLAVSIILLTLSHTEKARAGGTLDKISQTNAFVAGARQDAAPIGFKNEQGEWIGLGLDIAREIHKKLEKELGKKIQLAFLPIEPRTRIPLLLEGKVDIVCDLTAHTIRRDEVVDFSITWLVSGARLLTRKGGSIQEVEHLAGKKVGVVRESSDERLIRDLIDTDVIRPPAHLVVFSNHPEGLLALQQGAIDAYCADENVLAEMRMKAQNPSRWEIVGRLLTHDFYGLMVREDDSKFRDFVNFTLIDLIKRGSLLELYEKWHGPSGVAPLPMNQETRILHKLQSWPY